MVAAKKITKAPPQNEEANKVIAECYNAEFTLKETLKMIEDLKQADGSPYNVTYITTLWNQLGYTPRKRAEKAHKRVTEKKIAEAVAIAQTPLIKRSITVAVQQVLDMVLSKDQKAKLLQSILNGDDITSLRVERGDRSLRFILGQSSLLTLDKVQAQAILSHFKEIETFAQEV